MAACNCTSVCSVLLTLFSIVCFFLGLAIVAFPAMVVGFPHALEAYELADVNLIVCILLIVAGGLLVLSAIFGCVIGCKRPFCLIILFIVLVVVAIGLQVGSVLFMKDSVNKIFKYHDFDPVTGFKDRMPDYWLDDPRNSSIDAKQEEFRCCGYNSYIDWEDVPKNEKRMKDEKAVDGYIPRSCCKIQDSTACDSVEDIWTKPCKDALSRPFYRMKTLQMLFFSGPVASLLFQLLGLVIAIVLAVLVRKEKGDDRGQFIPMSNQTSL